MAKIIYPKEFFNIKDTLECGQIFRFFEHGKGFVVLSKNKCAYCYEQGVNTIIECNDSDEEYFYHFFDLTRDYSKIYLSALNEKEDILRLSASAGKGIRILNQDKEETLFSFIVSQNNNIPRIKGILEKLCLGLGEKINFNGVEFYAFPRVEKMAERSEEYYKSIGLGYRAEYIRRLAVDIKNGLNINEFSALSTPELKKKLISIYGVGPKVADCVALFSYHRSDSFPVDTWIEKVYREDFNGVIKDRAKITEYFAQRFNEYAGYYQQYLFFYKRLTEKT